LPHYPNTSSFLSLTPILSEPTRAQFRRLLKDAKRHKQRLPRTLFVPREYVADYRCAR
jgi:hypothetical protein